MEQEIQILSCGNLEDRGDSGRELEGNLRLWCLEESVSGGRASLVVSDAADGKLAIEFSSVEGFGELGKRNLGAEVEVKEWLSMFKKEWKENIWRQKR